MLKKEERHAEIITKIFKANEIAEQQPLVNLLVMKEAIEQELIKRGYYG